MKTDVNGCSTCQVGQENFEAFYGHTLKTWLVQYEYRHTNGQLFTCIAFTLDQARKRRDKFLQRLNK